jgi:hypothetical protein
MLMQEDLRPQSAGSRKRFCTADRMTVVHRFTAKRLRKMTVCDLMSHVCMGTCMMSALLFGAACTSLVLRPSSRLCNAGGTAALCFCFKGLIFMMLFIGSWGPAHLSGALYVEKQRVGGQCQVLFMWKIRGLVDSVR